MSSPERSSARPKPGSGPEEPSIRKERPADEPPLELTSTDNKISIPKRASLSSTSCSTQARSSSAPPTTEARLEHELAVRAPSSPPQPTIRAPDEEQPSQIESQEIPAGASAAGEGEDVASVVLDDALLAALTNPRDRHLLLRTELQLQAFLESKALTRLAMAPPTFPSGLNSYQRMLIHRLADRFGIKREVESLPTTSGPAPWPGAGGLSSGVVILVKTDWAATPARSLTSFVPESEQQQQSQPTPVEVILPPTLPPTLAPATLPSSAASDTPSTPIASTSSASSSSSHLPLTPATSTSAAPPRQVFKILPRNRGAASSASSSTGTGVNDDESASVASSKGKGKGRKELTLEERTAAYREARDRIFKAETGSQTPPSSASTPAPPPIVEPLPSPTEAGQSIARPASATSSYSRSSFGTSTSSYQSYAPSTHVYYPNSPHSVYQPQPDLGGWTASPFYPSRPPQAPGGYYPQSADEWSRSQHFQHYSQPPIQVTAPSPLTAYGMPPPPPPMGYHSPASSTYGVSPPAHYAHHQPPEHWHRQPGMPSPALSTSSHGSYAHHQHQSHAHSSTSGSTHGSESGSTSYLMRFPDGGVVPFGANSRSTSHSSASTSRTASSSNLRSSVGGASGSQSGAFLDGRRRASHHSARHSFGSASAVSSVVSTPSASEGSVRGGAQSVGKRSASTGTTSTSASASSVDGDEVEGPRTGRDRENTISKAASSPPSLQSTKEENAPAPTKSPIHPSLPVKPMWVGGAGPRQTKQQQQQQPQSGGGATRPKAGRAETAAAGPPVANVYQQLGPPHPPPAPGPGPGWNGPGPGYYSAPPGPVHAPPPVPYGYAQAPLGYPPPSLYFHPQALIPAPPPPPVPHHHPALVAMAVSGAELPSPQPQEMRRPPPKSTELFDPTQPIRSAAGGDGMRRSASAGAGAAKASAKGFAARGGGAQELEAGVGALRIA